MKQALANANARSWPLSVKDFRSDTLRDLAVKPDSQLYSPSSRCDSCSFCMVAQQKTTTRSAMERYMTSNISATFYRYILFTKLWLKLYSPRTIMSTQRRIGLTFKEKIRNWTSFLSRQAFSNEWSPPAHNQQLGENFLFVSILKEV